MIKEPAFTIGVEEEYLLVDKETRDLVADPDPGLCKPVLKSLGNMSAPS